MNPTQWPGFLYPYNSDVIRDVCYNYGNKRNQHGLDSFRKGTDYMDKKYLDDRVAAMCLPLAMIAALGMGQHRMAGIAALLALAGFLNMGTVRKKQAILWIMLGLTVCGVVWHHNAGGTWVDVLLLYGSAAMLYQSLDEESKRASKYWCLWIASFVALFGIIDLYMIRTGHLTGVTETGYLTGMLGTAEAAGLFFAMATLTDNSLRRRYIFCVALGMTGSVLGFLCLGAGLLFKKQDWTTDTLWTLIGLLFLIFPHQELWFLITVFLFWCIPETQAIVGKGYDKLGFLPFVIALLNPWSLFMVKDWGKRVVTMVNSWDGHFFFGTGPGETMLAGGLFQTAVELGIVTAFFFGICAMRLCKKPAGYAWVLNLIFGACALVPAPFLLGTGTGMADIPEEDEVNGRPYFLIMLIMGLYLCSRLNAC